MKRLQSELEKVQACIMKITEAYPSRIDKLKSKLLSVSPKTPGTPIPGTPIPSTPDTPEAEMKDTMDEDLLMAIALQKEEDALLDIMDSDEEEDDDFSHAKKRKVTKKRVARK